MADEARRGGAEAGAEQGPGQVYMHFVVMEDMMDKLKLMDYEEGFLKGLGFKPLSRYCIVNPLETIQCSM